MPIRAVTRSNPRTHVLMKAQARADGWQSEVRIRDLSETGALLEGRGEEPMPGVGEPMVLVHPRLEAAEAHVSWVEGRRFGIEFTTPLSPQQLFATR